VPDSYMSWLAAVPQVVGLVVGLERQGLMRSLSCLSFSLVFSFLMCGGG